MSWMSELAAEQEAELLEQMKKAKRDAETDHYGDVKDEPDYSCPKHGE